MGKSRVGSQFYTATSILNRPWKIWGISAFLAHTPLKMRFISLFGAHRDWPPRHWCAWRTLHPSANPVERFALACTGDKVGPRSATVRRYGEHHRTETGPVQARENCSNAPALSAAAIAGATPAAALRRRAGSLATTLAACRCRFRHRQAGRRARRR
jgi:hypothetical protein